MICTTTANLEKIKEGRQKQRCSSKWLYGNDGFKLDLPCPCPQYYRWCSRRLNGIFVSIDVSPVIFVVVVYCTMFCVQ